MNYDQLIDLLSIVGKTSDILHLMQQDTKDIRSFLEMVKTLYSSLTNRSMKIKFPKFRKRILKRLTTFPKLIPTYPNEVAATNHTFHTAMEPERVFWPSSRAPNVNL